MRRSSLLIALLAGCAPDTQPGPIEITVPPDAAVVDAGCRPGTNALCGEAVGICSAPAQTCQPDGTWGPCRSLSAPEDERCNGRDDDCDGSVDEALERDCGQRWGICEPGRQRCFDGVWGPCEGEVGPAEELCDGALDEDCDGAVDEGCDCREGETRSCSSDVGACQSGEQSCDAEGWGPCVGGRGPETERCDGAVDEDCDGLVDEDCACTDGDEAECGEGTGACEPGVRRCAAGQWGACEGGIRAAPEGPICDGEDTDCDGTVDDGLPDFAWEHQLSEPLGDDPGAAGIVQLVSLGLGFAPVVAVQGARTRVPTLTAWGVFLDERGVALGEDTEVIESSVAAGADGSALYSVERRNGTALLFFRSFEVAGVAPANWMFQNPLAPGVRSPSVAWSPEERVYLTVWADDDGLHAQTVEASPRVSPVGDRIHLAEGRTVGETAVVWYDEAFVVAYSSPGVGGHDIYAVKLRPEGGGYRITHWATPLDNRGEPPPGVIFRGAGDDRQPALASDGASLYLTFLDGQSGTPRPTLLTWNPARGWRGADFRGDDNDGPASHLRLAAFDQGVVLAWTTGRLREGSVHIEQHGPRFAFARRPFDLRVHRGWGIGLAMSGDRLGVHVVEQRGIGDPIRRHLFLGRLSCTPPLP